MYEVVVLTLVLGSIFCHLSNHGRQIVVDAVIRRHQFVRVGVVRQNRSIVLNDEDFRIGFAHHPLVGCATETTVFPMVRQNMTLLPLHRNDFETATNALFVQFEVMTNQRGAFQFLEVRKAGRRRQHSPRFIKGVEH